MGNSGSSSQPHSLPSPQRLKLKANLKTVSLDEDRSVIDEEGLEAINEELNDPLCLKKSKQMRNKRINANHLLAGAIEERIRNRRRGWRKAVTLDPHENDNEEPQMPAKAVDNREGNSSMRSRAATVGAKSALHRKSIAKESEKTMVPTVFRWQLPESMAPVESVQLAGSFNNWQPVSMAEHTKGHIFVLILELELGEHAYKYVVDGNWMHNPHENTQNDGVGGLNNVVVVRASDREVFEALDMDTKEVLHEKQRRRTRNDFFDTPSDSCFGQDVPGYVEDGSMEQYERISGPPILPPHLLQVILNKDTPLSCEPTLLPRPNHVMINHMYALSIHDNVMVMSATQRYRKKYVTTVIYRPIGEQRDNE